MNIFKAIIPGFARRIYGRSRSRLRTLLARKVAVCRVRGAVIRIGVSSEIELFRVDTYATKEPETLDWLDQNLRDGDVFVDVGANIGLYSLYAARIKPKCQVYAFEPAFQNYARLCKNIMVNDVQNVIPCSIPLANQERFDYFYVSDVQPGSAFHSFGQSSEYQAGAQKPSLRQGAFSLCLDTLVTKHGLPQPALVKIDVDGIEEKILEGARTILQSKQLRTLLVEWGAREAEDTARLKRLLEGCGLALSGTSRWMIEQDGLRTQNLIFHRT